MKSGQLLRNSKGEHLFVFSHVEPNEERFEYYPSYIGYNLSTCTVDEFKPISPVVSACLSALSTSEQLKLAELIPVRNALAAHTVAITAKARSGKDYVAEIIHRSFRYSSVVRALAEPIYEIDRSISGKVEGKNREMLILIGQGLREKDPNIWIKVWLRRNIEAYLKSQGTIAKANQFICQDLRQPNEYQFFKNLGAVVVGIDTADEARLNRIAELDGESSLNDTLLKDETERNAGTYDADYVLVNDYTPEFDSKVQEFISDVLVDKKGWK